MQQCIKIFIFTPCILTVKISLLKPTDARFVITPVQPVMLACAHANMTG
jgi:hypothetical protein